MGIGRGNPGRAFGTQVRGVDLILRPLSWESISFIHHHLLSLCLALHQGLGLWGYAHQNPYPPGAEGDQCETGDEAWGSLDTRQQIQIRCWRLTGSSFIHGGREGLGADIRLAGWSCGISEGTGFQAGAPTAGRSKEGGQLDEVQEGTAQGPA